VLTSGDKAIALDEVPVQFPITAYSNGWLRSRERWSWLAVA